MERIDTEYKNNENGNQENEMMREWERRHRRGRAAAGIIIIGIGSLFLAREMGVIFPHWLFSWKVLLIVIGFYVGIKHSFKSAGWLIPILIGTVFLLRDNFPDIAISHYLWPIAIIVIGLVVMFKPKRKRQCRSHRAYRNWKYQSGNEAWAAVPNEKKNSDDYLELITIFSGTEKKIITKDFRGGEITTVFGGAEADMRQADINGRVELEVNTIFGGTKIIVPSNWEIKSEITAVLGSVEDKRRVQRDLNQSTEKILVLRGSVVFGGIEIQSY